MILRHLFRFIFIAVLLCVVVPLPAQSEEIDTNKGVAVEQQKAPAALFEEPTHPPIKLSPDKSKLIRFDQTIDRVIVGNPIHLAVLPNDKNTIVLVGRAAGATYFTAMNTKGEIVMQRHVFVAAPQDNYVRIRRTCAASEQKECQDTQIYYCPDTCHDVALSGQMAEEDETSEEAPVGSGAGGDQQITPPTDSAAE